MKAVLLSAGQGRRLLPLTAEHPKCLLAVRGDEPLISVQLGTLARAGIVDATVVVGFGAEHVERFLTANPVPGLVVTTLFNPFYSTSDNLVSCWIARGSMNDDFLLLNGDTLFEDALAQTVLGAPSAPIGVTIDAKPDYDDDDMKVCIDPNGRLLAIGKDLPTATIGGESIGLISFRESGPKVFVDALEHAVREPAAMKRWYLSVVNDLCQTTAVETVSIRGSWWCEIDSAEDLALARSDLETRS